MIVLVVGAVAGGNALTFRYILIFFFFYLLSSLRDLIVTKHPDE